MHALYTPEVLSIFIRAPPYFVAACKAVVIIALSDVLVNVAPVVESTLLSSVTPLYFSNSAAFVAWSPTLSVSPNFVTSILFNKTLNILKSIGILLVVSFIFNLLLIFGYSGTLDIALVSNIALLGSIFMEQLSKKNDNLKFMHSGAISIVYLTVATLVFETSIVLYIFSFILGVFLELFLMKRRNIYITLVSILIFSVLGEVLVLAGVNTKSVINSYRAGRVENRLVKSYSDEDIFNLEKELASKNKSVLTYYELGMVKMTSSSKQDAKKVFLEGISFDDSFAPIYYDLAVIERQEGNYEKAKEYANRAYELDGREKNKNLVDELSK